MRIGVSLTYGILCSIGAAVGVMVPMIVKASGVFQDAPDLLSRPGLIVLLGMAVLLAGVVFASLAGAGREKMKTKSAAAAPGGGFAVGLIMVVIAGVFSVGWGFAFSYCQDPIIKAMKAYGAREIPARIAVWAVALLGAAVPNVLYPAWLLTRKKSWGVLAAPSGRDRPLARLRHLFLRPASAGRGNALARFAGGVGRLGIVQGT